MPFNANMFLLSLVIICWDNGLSTVWGQVIILSNAALLWIGPLQVNFDEFWINGDIDFQVNVLENVLYVMPFCSGPASGAHYFFFRQ